MARTEAKSKLTLLVPERIKRKARSISRRRRTSISRMFTEMIERETTRPRDPFMELWGIWADRKIDLKKIRETAWRRY